MKNPTRTNLGQQIEQLVQAHIAAVRAEAEAAVARAFAAVTSRQCAGAEKQQRPKAAPKRRSREELDALGTRLLELVTESPGATMSALAPKLGLSPRELHRPMSELKSSGYIRSVGQKNLTRYFPLAAAAKAAND